MSKQAYVVGFLFNTDLDVLLIRKNRPEWQAGKLNGIGGKIEDGEEPLEAMVREFEEEAGVRWPNWHNVAVLNGTKSEVHVFYSYSNTAFWNAETQESEPLERWNVANSTPEGAVPNLKWLIPAILNNEGEFIEVKYS